MRLATFHFELTLKYHHLEILQIKWEFLKYQIRNFTVTVSKTHAQKEQKQKKKNPKQH